MCVWFFLSGASVDCLQWKDEISRETNGERQKREEIGLDWCVVCLMLQSLSSHKASNASCSHSVYKFVCFHYRCFSFSFGIFHISFNENPDPLHIN